MKLKAYKCIGFLIAAFLISSLQAQKFDKKFNETFKVNKDVILAINASNAEIDVTTWNRNEVSVKAVITVEGLSKKEAQEFLKNWKFEALGNRSKVQINANANHFLHLGKNDFKFDFDFGDIDIPEINFNDIKIDIPEFEMPDIDIPEIKLNFDEIWKEIEESDFDKDNDDGVKTFSYQSNGKKKKVVIKSKKEWEKFKKSKEYNEMKKDLRRSLKEAQEQIKSIDMKKIRKEIEKAQIKVKKIDKKKIEAQIRKAKAQYARIDKVKIKESLAAAKESIERMKAKMENSYKSGNHVFVIEKGNSKKKVKITRKISVKVPKGAKFDLNTRHSKVKLPKGKTSGKVSYGTFNANEINGGVLDIFYAPVKVNVLKESTLSLNNITDATIASVMNTKLTSNSSKLKINYLESDVELINKFGELFIEDVIPNLKGLKLNLSYSDTTIDLKNFKGILPVLSYSKKINKPKVKNSSTYSGRVNANSTIIDVKGKQSELTIKNQ